MRLKITEGVNRVDGKPMFYLYEDKSGEGILWTLLYGSTTIDECRAFADRHRNPVPERVVEEFEG